MTKQVPFPLSKKSSFLTVFSYDAIICLAGGFGMGSVKDKEVFEEYQKLDKMNL